MIPVWSSDTIAPTSTCAVVPLSDGAQLFCRISGNGDPVLFLHGNRDNHTHFAELTSILDSAMTCVAVDLRGHGLSSKEDHPLSAVQCASDIIELLDHFGWGRVTVVGHSLGSVTAMLLALDHPERVSRLVLMGSAAHYEMKWKRPEVTEDTYRQVIEESNKRAAPFFFQPDHPGVSDRVIASWSWVPFSVHRNLIRLIHPDLRERVAKIDAPTLVVAGSDDRSTPVDRARFLADTIPDAELTVLAGTGHFMFMERPEQVASEIARFTGVSLGGTGCGGGCGCGHWSG
ncbi:alpha/beta hydrolase [Actinomadura meridiana]|uniref:Alpha/beta hydrolase n=1 Tax=Actinomadura meridiana TaxID=559626 RepID=A0ABP8C4I5_9ACTN